MLSSCLPGQFLNFYGGVSISLLLFCLVSAGTGYFRGNDLQAAPIPATIQAGRLHLRWWRFPDHPQPEYYSDQPVLAQLRWRRLYWEYTAVMMFALSMLWLGHAKRYEKKGLFLMNSRGKSCLLKNAEDLPHPLISLIPLIPVICCHNVLPAILPVGDFVKANMIIPALRSVILLEFY